MHITIANDGGLQLYAAGDPGTTVHTRPPRRRAALGALVVSEQLFVGFVDFFRPTFSLIFSLFSTISSTPTAPSPPKVCRLLMVHPCVCLIHPNSYQFTLLTS